MHRILALTLVFALACVAPAAMAAAATPGAPSDGGPAGWWSTVTDLLDGWMAAVAASTGSESTTQPQEPDGTTTPEEGGTDGADTVEEPGGEAISGWTPWG